jgi:glycosyltransferase involved in cell wall biosynthesis
VIHHGFDPQTFFSDVTPFPADIQQKLDESEGCLRLLFVSHYNYYRNFETLFRALPLIQNSMPEKRVKLFLTCRLEPGANPGAYNGASAGRLVKELGIATSVVQLGAVPYASLHHLYRVCDLYVTPAYAETFAHPLVEAMASGLPVIASDLRVHKEVCGNAALYFPRFSPEALAEAVVRIACSCALAAQLSEAGRKRSSDFSWAEHVDRLLELVTQGRLVDSHQEKIAALSVVSRAS